MNILELPSEGLVTTDPTVLLEISRALADVCERVRPELRSRWDSIRSLGRLPERRSVKRAIEVALTTGPLAGLPVEIRHPEAPRRGAQAIVLNGARHSVVLFRGTEWKSWRDIWADIHFDGEAWEFGGRRAVVHEGFKDVVAALEGEIDRHLQTGVPVWVAGHSLGGAMAALFAARNPERVVGTVTFGAPKVGKGGWSEAWEGRAARLLQWQNATDPVPLIPVSPFARKPFVHVGRRAHVSRYSRVRFGAEVSLKGRVLRPRAAKRHHPMARYAMSLRTAEIA